MLPKSKLMGYFNGFAILTGIRIENDNFKQR